MRKADLEHHLAEWLAGLTGTQRRVVVRRFGLDGEEMASLDDLAKDLEVGAERVRQIQIEALEGLAKRLTGKRVEATAIRPQPRQAAG